MDGAEEGLGSGGLLGRPGRVVEGREGTLNQGEWFNFGTVMGSFVVVCGFGCVGDLAKSMCRHKSVRRDFCSWVGGDIWGFVGIWGCSGMERGRGSLGMVDRRSPGLVIGCRRAVEGSW